MVCPKCGKEVEEGVNICPFCGENLDGTGGVGNEVVQEPVVNNEVENKEVEEKFETPIPVQEITEEVSSSPTTNESASQTTSTVVDVPTAVNLSTTNADNQPVETPIPVQETKPENILNDTNEVNPEAITNTGAVSQNGDVLKDEPKLNIPSKSLESIVTETTSVNFGPTESEVKSVANETSDTIMDANALQEVEPVIETVSVDNVNLETVSVDVSDQKEEVVEEVIEKPVLPEPTIGEVNSDALINSYEEEEKMNNEMIAEKKRLDEEERQRKLLEEQQKIANMEKPDLLAVDQSLMPTTNDESADDMKKKKRPNTKKILDIVTIAIILVIGLVAVWYFFLREKEEKANDNYMQPIVSWFKGYNDGNTSAMLSSYVPCLSNVDEIITEINNRVNSRLTNKNFYLEYKEEKSEVVNSQDQAELDSYLSERCSSTPKIEEYKRVYIDEKLSVSEDKKMEDNHPQFFVVKIENKWYILAFQGQ